MYKAKDHKAQVITECDKTIFKKEKIQNKPRILIVDASEFNRAILKEILEETYEIIEADGGNEALHKIDEYGMKISLVLLDIIMPEKDGFEVLKYMEEERLISDIPVIIISSEVLRIISEELMRWEFLIILTAHLMPILSIREYLIQ